MSVVVLSGGVGGAKLVEGLAQVLPNGALRAIVNTGDDFVHLGLSVSPDIDSVIYMLAGKADDERGWGVSNESWHFMDALAHWQAENWFNLGDRDLAMHVLRTQALAGGAALTNFTARIASIARPGVAVLPMTDARISTVIDSEIGTLPFQDYFVRHRCEPVVRAIRFEGYETAAPTASVLAALSCPELEAICIAPSNPYLSVDPILSVPGLRAAIRAAGVPVVAVSPIIGGKAVKGPTGKMMNEMGLTVANTAIAQHYDGLIDGMLIDHADEGETLGLPVRPLNILMCDAQDRRRVAEAALFFARSLC